ncbi:MAG: hypothetical protein JKY65_02455 [Planctomycetes bacterium]|nr:hypothetical protein [Planctomycetota bacterium]
MRFECVDDVRHSAAEVFILIRDEMPSLVPYLDDVQEIVVTARREEGTSVHITNLWRGSSAKAPKVVQKFLSPDLLSWKDHATWHEGEIRYATWRLEPKMGGRLFECSGKTSILEINEGSCQIQIQGELRIYPERLPGVPRILAARLRGKIESFVVKMLVPNLQTMARGVQAYFDDVKAEQE